MEEKRLEISKCVFWLIQQGGGERLPYLFTFLPLEQEREQLHFPLYSTDREEGQMDM